MSDTHHIVDIFLSSPFDLKAERAAVVSEIAKLSRVTEKFQQVRLRVLTFENNTYTALGESGQDVVNQQIGDSYQIYLGLVGKRLGTPTPKDESGTAEEYQRALDRAHSNGSVPSLMFFVVEKRITVEDEVHELLRVKQFVTRIRSDGLLTVMSKTRHLRDKLYTQLFEVLSSKNFFRYSNADVLKSEAPASEGRIDDEFASAQPEIHDLVNRANTAQAELQDSFLELASIVEHLDGRAESWSSRWIVKGQGFNFLKARSSNESKLANKELVQISAEIVNQASRIKRRFRVYIDESIRLYSHNYLRQGIHGVGVLRHLIRDHIRLAREGAMLMHYRMGDYNVLHHHPQLRSGRKAVLSTLASVAEALSVGADLLDVLKPIVDQIKDHDESGN